MRVERASVGGPDYIKLRTNALNVVNRLERHNYDFDKVPEVYAKNAQADVVAKEIAVFFDGDHETMIGRLVMAGVGHTFNLMGPHSADAEFRSSTHDVLGEINRQLGTRGLREFPAFERLPEPQRIQFFNRTNFFTIRDLVFWHVLRGAGCFPSAIEIMQRHFAEGKVVYNNLYAPAFPSEDPRRPALMTSEGSDLFLSFPTKAVVFNEPSMFGGLVGETMHVEYLLTPKKVDTSHPHLPLSGEAVVNLYGRRYFLRRFSGISPKLGLRGPKVPAEGKPFEELYEPKASTKALDSKRLGSSNQNFGRMDLDDLETWRNPLTVKESKKSKGTKKRK